MINMEIKARVEAPDRVRQVLLEQGARHVGTDRQHDTYFCVPRGRLKLRRGAIENVLVYYERPDQPGPKPCDYELAALAPDNAAAAVLARALGVLVEVSKKRDIYRLDNLKFHVDEVDGLGSFAEIEAGGRDRGDLPRLREQCERFMRLFGIAPDDLLEESYSDMLLSRTGQSSSSSREEA